MLKYYLKKRDLFRLLTIILSFADAITLLYLAFGSPILLYLSCSQKQTSDLFDQHMIIGIVFFIMILISIHVAGIYDDYSNLLQKEMMYDKLRNRLPVDWKKTKFLTDKQHDTICKPLAKKVYMKQSGSNSIFLKVEYKNGKEETFEVSFDDALKLVSLNDYLKED